MDYKELIPGCTHFTWAEALWLPSWKCYHIPSEEEKDNLIKVFQKMELIRNYLDSPINIHVAIRPILNNPTSNYHGQDYNILVSGAPNSAHKIGAAVDWHPIKMSCDEAKAKLISQLKDFDIRLEKDTTSWIHIDILQPNPNRYFASK